MQSILLVFVQSSTHNCNEHKQKEMLNFIWEVITLATMESSCVRDS